MIKLRIRWAGHAAHAGEIRNAYKIVVGKPDVRRSLRGHGIGRRIILKLKHAALNTRVS
jgi:predicted GNAT family acetyltransferase